MCLPVRRRNLCATCSIATPMRSTTIPTSSSNIFPLNSSQHLHVVIAGSSLCSSFRSFHSRRYHPKSSSSAFANLTFQNRLYPLPTLPLVSGVQLSSFRNVHDDCKDLAKLQQELKRQQLADKLEQVTDLIYEKLFGRTARRVLAENGKNVDQYNRFLETVDLIAQHLPPKEQLNTATTTSSSSSFSTSGSNFKQLTDLMYEGLFGNSRCTALTENEKNVAYCNRFLETVDFSGQNVSPDKDSSGTSHSATPPPPLPPPPPPTSSSSSSSASSSTRRPTSKSKDRKLQQKRKRQPHHRRVFSYGLAKWINDNPDCGSLEFEKFYRKRLPYYCGIRDGERFLQQWSPIVTSNGFGTYLADVIQNVVQRALYDVKQAFTIADMARRHPHHRSHIRDLSFNFSRVLATKKDVESLKSRNIKFYELFVPAEKDIPLQPDKISVVSGASGSGKTITALAAATREQYDVVFYTVVRDTWQLTPQKWTVMNRRCTTSEQKDIRNEVVKDWVMEQIDNILDETQVPLLIDASVFDYNVVIVVDDVGCCSGFSPGLRASLADLSIELHNKFFLPGLDPVANKEDWHEKSRIRFVAAGSGASYATADVASNADRYNTYFIGKQNSTNTGFETAPIFATILSGTQNDVLEGVLSRARYDAKQSELEQIVRMLKRLDPEEQRRIRLFNQQTIRDYEANPEDSQRSGLCQEAWITPTEKAAADLVTNARCAALLIKVALDDAIVAADGVGRGSFEPRRKLGHPQWWKSAAAFNTRLQYWIPAIIEKYMSMNGLTTEDDPLEALRHALAATIFRLPCLPDSAPWLWWALDSSHTEGLINKYGVLVDYATATKCTKGVISLDDFADLSEQDRMCALKVDETTARYYTSPAHVVMFRSGCGLTLDRPPELPVSSTFKYDLAEFCALTLICASAYTDMVEKSKFLLLDWKTKRTLLDRFDEKYNYKHDSLFGLKKKLARDYCPAGFTGAKIIHLFDSPLLSMPKYIVAKKKEEVEKLEKSARVKAMMLRTEIETSLKQQKAVVIISKEMESFADVIVVSRGRVMLIQCKQKLQPRKKYLKKLTAEDNRIEWVDDIEKMCGLDPDQSPTRKQRRADKMRNIYFEELKRAAAAAAAATVAAVAMRESPDVTKVKVELAFVVEGEKAVCNLFAEGFKRLQVTDENAKKNENDQQLFPSISAGAKTISAEKYFDEKKEIITLTRTTRGYPISFFGVYRRRQTTIGQAPSSSSHSYPPPLFPVPDYSEGVQGSQDNGSRFAIGEHLAPYQYVGNFWRTNVDPYYEEEY